MMGLFGAATGTYYPDNSTYTTTYGGCANSSNTFFAATDTAVIRAFLISNAIATAPVIKIIGTDSGDVIAQWTAGVGYAQNLLCGPEGFKIAGGFYVDVSAASGAYVTVIYDKS